MNKVTATDFADPPWRKYFPIRFVSDRKVCYGVESHIEFDFKRNVIISWNSGLPCEIARIVSSCRKCRSIEGFLGVITGNYFSLSVEKSSIFVGTSIEIVIRDQFGKEYNIKEKFIELSSRYNYFNLVKCLYDSDKEELEVSYVLGMEDFAKIVGSILFRSHAIGRNRAGF